MTRLLGAAAAAVVACAAFLGGQAIAGGNDKASDAKPVRAQVAQGAAPEVLQRAQDAVVLPVIAVRQLPVLAAPHRKKGVKQTPTQPVTPAIQTPIQRNVTPSAPVTPTPRQNTTPRNNSGGGGGGGGSGGYFDDSG